MQFQPGDLLLTLSEASTYGALRLPKKNYHDAEWFLEGDEQGRTLARLVIMIVAVEKREADVIGPVTALVITDQGLLWTYLFTDRVTLLARAPDRDSLL